MVVPSHFRRGLYLVPLRIGGSLDRISSRHLMFDTGSDLSWTQCYPCRNCGQGHFAPYIPFKSSTFRSVSCDDPLCEHAPDASCDESGTRQCKFFREYVGGSMASGYLASDIFHFSLDGNTNYHFEPEVVFGCATAEKSGILALGTSSLSFLAQVRVDKFYLRFGSQARISGKRIPFWNDKDKYYVHLKRVTYQHGNRLSQQQPVPIYPGDGGPEGSTFEMLVESGTLGIWLPESTFYPLQKKIDTDISLIRVHFDVNPNNGCCYIGTMKDVEEVSVTLGFVGGAEMELFGDSLFFEYNDSEWICLGFTPSNTTVLGIYAQRNTNMGFDLSEREISIDQAGCRS
ncbi:protein ASPARTIC PROTEASE IN GUARD CELL 1-like [Panicum hallii]|uniref:protein ASPARTIC PROTEASE IN GUARD CELL 1-like n=1 Tax=Panicum hallii TaxID=206008 RepID=UPI000DF4DF0C|nr:protein ASPARTIC PROTEASE IN GUARD CELL 1-like [Panicum hallii]